MARIGIAEELSRAEACPPFVGSSFFFLEKMAIYPRGYSFAVYGVTTLRKGEMHSSDLYLDNRISGSVYKTQNAAEASTTSLERPV